MMIDEWARILEGGGVMEIVTRHSIRGTGEDHDKTCSGYSVSRARLDASTSPKQFQTLVLHQSTCKFFVENVMRSFLVA
jgi:hypothetical protein